MNRWYRGGSSSGAVCTKGILRSCRRRKCGSYSGYIGRMLVPWRVFRCLAALRGVGRGGVVLNRPCCGDESLLIREQVCRRNALLKSALRLEFSNFKATDNFRKIQILSNVFCRSHIQSVVGSEYPWHSGRDFQRDYFFGCFVQE